MAPQPLMFAIAFLHPQLLLAASLLSISAEVGSESHRQETQASGLHDLLRLKPMHLFTAPSKGIGAFTVTAWFSQCSSLPSV